MSDYTRIPTLHHIDVTPFLDLMLAVARERTVDGIIERTRRTYRGTHVVFGGLWFVQSGHFSKAPDPSAPGADRRLFLRAWAGEEISGPLSWLHDGENYNSIPFTEPIIGTVAATGKLAFSASPENWNRPEWAVREGFQAYTVLPVIHGEQLLGVMVVFYKQAMTGELADMFRMHRKMHKIFADTLAAALANAQAFEEIQHLRRELELENEQLRRTMRTWHGDDIVGDSPALAKVMEQVEVVAPTDATVLLLGESGTGKELLAQAIHQRSSRRTGPLVRVNCSAIPHELFESEFFGHVKGSFTGAHRDRTGRFQMADGGTLFLDEIGEIPLELQGKLLRILQEGTFEPIGDERSRKVDVRIIAATNRDLAADVNAGTFRQDLYFRLSVFPITNPPLRERMEDIPLLARHFTATAAKRLNLGVPKLYLRHITQLQQYDWPGNVRELQNVLERAVIMSDGGALVIDTPQADIARGPLVSRNNRLIASSSPAFGPVEGMADTTQEAPGTIITEAQWKELQRRNIIRALETTQWRVHGEGGAAELLGLRPTTLQSRIKKYNITRTTQS